MKDSRAFEPDWDVGEVVGADYPTRRRAAPANDNGIASDAIWKIIALSIFIGVCVGLFVAIIGAQLAGVAL